MHKNNGFIFGQNHIGFTREVFCVQTVTETMGKKEAAHQHLRFGILAFYAAHIL